MEKDKLVKELQSLLEKGNAHVSFSEAVKNIPFEDLGKKTEALPYSIWQIVEHIRITQKDILDFSIGDNYKELNWPDDYWTKDVAPEDDAAWKDCINQIQTDLDTFIKLLNTEKDLFQPFEHGNGQNLLREAMLIADHASYHTGEIIVIRRLLGNWKNS